MSNGIRPRPRGFLAEPIPPSSAIRLVLSEPCGKDGESGGVRRGGEEGEILAYSCDPADPSSPPSVAAPHHVGELPFDLGPSGPVSVLPGLVLLGLSVSSEKLMLLVESDGASSMASAAAFSEGTALAGHTKAGDATSVTL